MLQRVLVALFDFCNLGVEVHDRVASS
jgi:hypothetical protein